MMRALWSIGVFAALSLPAWAVTDAWQDLQDRCTAAVLSGERLDVQGLEDRLPDVLFDVVESDLLGPRVELEFSGPGGRTVPTGVWGTKNGPFELWLIEYPTRAGFRAICEVRTARQTRGLDAEQASALRDAFSEGMGGGERTQITVSNEDLTAFRLSMPNPRGCPVVTSFVAGAEGGAMRSSVSEAAGAPTCGGPSLASGVITPHGVLPEPRKGG